ncbi:MAG: cytosine deaminase [Candidatus Methanomethyliales bacterium]|nr:cytosine deaminase [Candidatus Methanomethylicales archaeon]
MDLIIRRAKLMGKDGTVDIGVSEGKITTIKKEIKERGNEEFDAGGRLVLPTFTDMHIHLDSVLTLGTPRYNESGTLLEGIAIWGEYKKKLNIDEMKARAMRALELIASNGTTRVRTHADVTEPTLSTLKGLLELKKECADIIDLEVTAFPQDGILTDPGNQELLERALELGADNVGIIPHIEYTREDGVRSVELAFKLAKKYGKKVDGHVDETDDEQSRFLEVVAAQTIREGYQGKVTAGHTTAMHSYNNAYAFKLFGLLKKADITIVANPLINIHLQGRFDTYPKRRGLTRIKELLQHGINVALGHDCIMDPWYPLGNGDMLHALFMGVHVGQLTGYRELLDSLNLITYNPARALGISERYGVEEGKDADLVVMDAFSELEAIRTMAPRLLVVKSGRVIIKTEPAKIKIVRDGKEKPFNRYL